MTTGSSAVWGNKETEFFFALTPDRILGAVERLGYRCTGRSIALNSMENRVYEVEIELLEEPESRSDKFKIVKFYRPGRWTREQILAEHQFLFDLNQVEIPVVVPEQLNGESVLRMEDQDLFYAVFPKIGGRNPDELDNELLARCGRLLARMHNVGAAKEAPERIKITPESFGLRNLEYLLQSQLLPFEYQKRYAELVEAICAESSPLFQEAAYQRVHGDAHLGNLLFNDSGLFFVDFDDMLRAPVVQDIWLLLSGQEDPYGTKRELLLAAYEELRPFDRRSLVLIEPLRALRFIHFTGWIAHRWEDPAFKRVFENFGTSQYWAVQIADLENQLRLIRHCQA